eukprot:1729875-Amphidinium_carterae.1
MAELSTLKIFCLNIVDKVQIKMSAVDLSKAKTSQCLLHIRDCSICGIAHIAPHMNKFCGEHGASMEWTR